MKQYLDLCKKILEEGTYKDDRTGTGTYSIFGYQARYDLSKGFPLVTTKKVFLRGIIHELLWFISGDTNIKYLVDNDVHIWDDWAYKAYKESDLEQHPLQDDQDHREPRRQHHHKLQGGAGPQVPFLEIQRIRLYPEPF